MGSVATGSWRLAMLGLALVGAGFLSIVVASIQGMALVPGASILDGYDIGLLPWMNVGSWLVPLGGIAATVGGLLAIWLGRSRWLVRVATVPALLVAVFWVLLAVIGTAPRNAVDGTTSSSDLATFVYSSPANTIAFLLIPAAVVVLLATTARRGGRR